MKRLVFTLLAMFAGIATVAFGLVDAYLALRGIYLFWTLAWGQLAFVSVVGGVVGVIAAYCGMATAFCVEVASHD